MNKQMASVLNQGDNTQVVLISSNGEVTITSVELTQLINQFRLEEGNTTEKRHSDLITSIKTEIETLEKANIAQRNFSLGSYRDLNNQERPCYSMNKAGALQMLNKESAVVRYKTVQYIEKLEKQNKQINPYLGLSKELQAIFAIDAKQQEQEQRLSKLENDMPLFNSECKELQNLVRKKGIEVLGGYKSKAYNNKSLRTKVYTDIQRQLKREFGVCRYEAIKHSQLELAKQIIEQYKAPTVLVQEISLLNSQTTLFDKKKNRTKSDSNSIQY